MTDARDRAISALCDTIADLRKRIADLEIAAAIPRPTFQPTEAKPEAMRGCVAKVAIACRYPACSCGQQIEPGKAYYVGT